MSKHVQKNHQNTKLPVSNLHTVARFEEFVASHQLSGQLDHHPSMPSDAGICPPPVEQGKPIEPIGSPKPLAALLKQ